MTREEAIKTLKENYCAMCAYGSQDMDSCDIRSCDNKDAIKALEQEPCEDEYIKVPKKALKYRTTGMVAYNAEWLKNHFDIERAVICGAQEPCDDAISRQTVKEQMIKYGFHAPDMTITEFVEDILSVKSQEPMCEFTEEEAKAYSKALDKIYKPTGFNVFNELCEDAISRQAVLDTEYQIKEINGIEYVMLSEVQMKIRKMPSVKPQEPKTGYWIDIDEEPHEVWECDHCGFVIDGSGCIDPYDYRDTYKYCPNCGAKMEVSE